jgi:hypothetical protein
MNKNLVVGFDVDGTLVGLINDEPREDVIAIYRAFQALGATMIIASGGGAQRARLVADRLSLLPHHALSKTDLVMGVTCDIFFDDSEFCALGKVNVCVSQSSSE